MHPYRVEEDKEDEVTPAIPTAISADHEGARFEERAVSIVLFCAGIVGVAIGISAPRADGMELALGALFAALGVWTWFSEGTRRSAMKRTSGLSNGRRRRRKER
jgi:hypothetical protein